MALLQAILANSSTAFILKAVLPLAEMLAIVPQYDFNQWQYSFHLKDVLPLAEIIQWQYDFNQWQHSFQMKVVLPLAKMPAAVPLYTWFC